MNRLYIVMYHYIRDLRHSRYPGIKGLAVELFRRQIAFFNRNFTVVTMEEVLEKQLPKNAMLLTFDDGYMDHYNYVLPVLEEAGMQGSFFIPGKAFAEHKLLDVNKIHFILACADMGRLLPDVFERMNEYRGGEYCYPSNEELAQKYMGGGGSRFDAAETVFVKRMLQTVLPEKIRNRITSDLFDKYVGIPEEQMAYELYMTREQIRTLKRHGMFIGVHGYDHYWLGNLSEKKMQEDVSKALEVMEEFIDIKRWVMNYPYGNYNSSVLHYIQERGACMGLTTQAEEADFEKHGMLELPRMDCNDFPPISERYKEVLV